MGIKTAVVPRHEIPLQKDGRSELQELAAALSQQVDQRHRDRGTYPAEPAAVSEPTHYDLSAEPEPPPQPRAPEPLSKSLRRVVPLVFAAVLTATVSAAAWTTTHSSPRAQQPQPTAPTTRQAPTAPTTPTTPAEWGAAAHQRLSQGGRPVDVFACQGAYAADAAVANGVLPPAAASPETWQAYLAACLPDMSDTHTGRSG